MCEIVFGQDWLQNLVLTLSHHLTWLKWVKIIAAFLAFKYRILEIYISSVSASLYSYPSISPGHWLWHPLHIPKPKFAQVYFTYGWQMSSYLLQIISISVNQCTYCNNILVLRHCLWPVKYQCIVSRDTIFFQIFSPVSWIKGNLLWMYFFLFFSICNIPTSASPPRVDIQ